MVKKRTNLREEINKLENRQWKSMRPKVEYLKKWIKLINSFKIEQEIKNKLLILWVKEKGYL